MSIQDSIDLFNTKINKTYWTRQNVSPTGKILKTVPNPVLLPVDNYYKILQKKYVKVGENSGSVVDFQTSNFAEYFANLNSEKVIAVVKSIKTVDSIPTKIAIATYYDQCGDIAIINRFDQSGRPHDNYFEVYGDSLSASELDFYKKYLVDRETVINNEVHYQADVPHMHFNTRRQTLAFGHHDKANAISIFKLFEYLEDLKADMNPNSYINNKDLGMPFLDLKKAKLEYTSTMLNSVQEIIGYLDSLKRVNPTKFSDYEKDTIELMKSLIDIDRGDSDLSIETVGPTMPGTSSNYISFISSQNLTRQNNQFPTNSSINIENIIQTMPFLNGMSIAQLKEIKIGVSKLIKEIEDSKKRINKKDCENYIPDTYNNEMDGILAEYKNYLKYIKGLINLESISVDLKKYIQIYEILNERDPMLLSVVSNELLKNLTINIKPISEMNKGGVISGYNRQPE